MLSQGVHRASPAFGALFAGGSIGDGQDRALRFAPWSEANTGPHYRHRQIGWVIVGAIAAGVALVAPIVAIPGAPQGVILIGAILALAGLLFSTLTVEVDRRELRVSFSGGLVRRRVALTDIREARVVRSPWYYGWGIHVIPGGWIWNVSGWYSVETVLRDGHLFRVGTDEPEILLRAIRQVAPQTASTHLGMESVENAPRRPRLTIGIASAIVAGVALFLTPFYLWTRPPKVTVTSERIEIESPFYGDQYPIPEITEVTLETRLPRIRARTNGFAGGGLLRGWFVVDGMGEGKLFVDAGNAPYIVIRMKQGFVIVNFSEPGATEALFREIQGVRQPSGLNLHPVRSSTESRS